MTLVVILQDGRREAIFIPEGVPQNDALHALMHASPPFEKPWVKLASGEYVRQSFIVAIKPPTE